MFDDPDASILTDLTADSDILFVAFGGIAGALGVPVYEFFNVAESLPVKKMFIRDLGQSWYHCGTDGRMRNIKSTANFLSDFIAQEGIKRTVFTGNSAGGYAALLFGCMLQADIVISFAPQTFISPWLRLRYHDVRWARQIWRLYANTIFSKTYFDLRKRLLHNTTMTEYHIYYSTDDPLDKIHAERMSGLPGVKLHPYTAGGHELVRELRDQGDLKKIFVQTFGGFRH
jgi:hypothetical protein